MKYTAYKRPRSHWKLPVLGLAILLLGAGIAAALFITPGFSRPSMGEGDIRIGTEETGSLSLYWPESPDADVTYLVSLRTGEEKKFRLIGQTAETSAALSGVTLDEPLELKIQAVVFGKNLLGMTRELTSRDSIQVTVTSRALPRPVLQAEASEDKSVSLRWSAQSGSSYEICTLDDEGYYIPLSTVTTGSATLHFGVGGDLDMPSYDRPAYIAVRTAYQGEGYVLYGPYSQPATVEKESLLGDELSLEYQESDERMYTLRWNETKGDYYEIQEWSEEYSHWETLTRIDRDAEMLCYETGRLGSGSSHRYRVAAYDQEAALSFGISEDNGFAADPAEVSFRVSISPLYCTIWPVIDLELYSDVYQSRSLSKVPGGTALCVLEEKGDWFYVRYKDNYGYIDKRFCMIDLPEYLGDWCSYNITNSYNSVFKVHQYPIESITYQVIQGFENIQLGEGSYLVPYLYPCANKLLKAAQTVQADGYRLKIYEAFRPNEATRFLFDTTSLLLDTAVPELDEEGLVIDARTGLSMDPDTGFLIDPETGELIDPATIPDPEPEPDPETDDPTLPPEEGSEEDGDENSEPTLPPEEIPVDGEFLEEQPLTEETTPVEEPPLDVLTFGHVMTDGRFKISSFLAAQVSAHNRGIALDLTLETLDTAEELEMQSAIHDLSWYSATYLNNDNAKLLYTYMTNAGLADLSSEWWHFQDNETREAIGLTSYLYKGVNAEGWKKDDTGWRYRAADGSYYRGVTITVDSKSYTLDGNGYVVEP